MRGVTLPVAALLVLLVVPVPAQSQVPMASWATRGHGSGYLGVGAFAATGAHDGAGEAMLKMGRILNDHLLVGLEGGAFSYSTTERGPASRDHQHNFLDAMVTWFPSATGGGFLKAGVGYGTTIDKKLLEDRTEESQGFEARFGAGWEFRMSTRWHFGIEAVSSAYKEAQNGDFMVLLTLTTY